MNYTKFNELKEKNKHYWGQRICSEVEFANALAAAKAWRRPRKTVLATLIGG